MNKKILNVTEIDLGGGDDKKEEKKLPQKVLDGRMRKMRVFFAKMQRTNSNWKNMFKGMPGKGKKESKFWHNSRLITKEEHDKLSHAEIMEWNNKIGRS